MHVKVLFFGVLKDVVGGPEDRLEIAEGARLANVFDHYAARFPRLRDMANSIVLARNQEFSRLSADVQDGDEVAFLPPVSGGAGDYLEEIRENGNLFALTRHQVDPRAIARELLCGEDGAVVTFEGVVRNNTKGRPTLYLDYECYEAMAIRVMAQLACELARGHAISRVAMVHRLGRLQIGETSVAVLVTAPHRKPAFEAALEGINRLKRTVPIWKKEYFAGGEVWVEGEWDQSVQPQ